MLTAMTKSTYSLLATGIVLALAATSLIPTTGAADDSAAADQTPTIDPDQIQNLGDQRLDQVPDTRLPPSAATEPATPTFPWVGEELYYSVQINGSEAMRGGIRVGDVHSPDQRAYVPLNGFVQSRGFLDAAYPIDDNANTFIEPDRALPLRSEKTFDENDEFRSYDVQYDHTSFVASVERKRENRESTFESPIPDGTHDMMSWLYELRQTDELAVGDTFSYYIYDGWLLSRLELEVVDRVDLLTPLGWFKTWEFDFTREIKDTEDNQPAADDQPGPPQLSLEEEARHTGNLWLSRDENRIPVKVTIDTTFGAGDVVLIHYEPGESG